MLMEKNKRIGFVVVTIIIGFMLAVQFNTVNEPEIRDTRDLWELKSDLLNEQKVQAQLMKEVTELEQQLVRYDSGEQVSKEQILNQTLQELKEEAGLTDITGQGIILKIEPISSGLVLEEVNQISPELLKRLINELNMYDAKHISINNRRIINSTVIRDINGVTKIDGYSLSSFPIEIKVIAEDAEKLRDRLKVSQSIEEFFIDNFNLTISKLYSTITIPAYDEEIRIPHLKTADQGKGGDN